VRSAYEPPVLKVLLTFGHVLKPHQPTIWTPQPVVSATGVSNNRRWASVITRVPGKVPDRAGAQTETNVWIRARAVLASGLPSPARDLVRGRHGGGAACNSRF